MKKLLAIGLMMGFGFTQLQAQSVEEAQSHIYYGKYTSAKNTLNQVLANKAKNADAIYWLGQTHLKEDDLQAAKTVYQNAVQSGIQAPILTVGLGHIALLEGDNAKAKQLFEEAIASSTRRKKEDPAILNAVGRANADGPSTVGDPAYGIAVLERAAAIDPNNAETYMNMGINYLKMGNDRGGDAYGAFTSALRVDPNHAAAKYRLGKIFLTQGNREKFEGYFIGATESDPKYAPAYLELYNYYAQRDVNKAKEYLENYMANSDKDCNVDFFYADYLFRAGKYQESLDKGKAMANGNCKDLPRLPVLFAYNYDRLGDTANARASIEQYLANAPKDKVQPDDYLLAANVLKKMPGREDAAINYLKVAIQNDTVKSNQYMYMDTIASLYKKKGDFANRLQWLQKSYALNPSPSNLDIYNLGDAALQVENYDLADSMFNTYATKYPEQVYGFIGLARSAVARDKDTTAGSAVPAVRQLITFLEKDPQKNKSMLLQQYAYLVYVQANVFKDYAAALQELEGILRVDPENSYAKQTSEQIKKVMSASSRQSQASSKKS
ncbi:tetratricopeptide repeat protein [Aridibaculum aurantiacum]|uniref:tetratricopeptide repeat protein n=1 Tax=Aridibaculum aurantiacum TaxID=2810307 RepID=UPI001A956E62|nr:tetratricopeptide repeat protein [Aridibaculum aurantiacum]